MYIENQSIYRIRTIYSSRHPFKSLEAYISLIRRGHCSNRSLIIIILAILNCMFNALEFAGCFHRCHFYHEDISEIFLKNCIAHDICKCLQDVKKSMKLDVSSWLPHTLFWLWLCGMYHIQRFLDRYRHYVIM